MVGLTQRHGSRAVRTMGGSRRSCTPVKRSYPRASCHNAGMRRVDLAAIDAASRGPAPSSRPQSRSPACSASTILAGFGPTLLAGSMRGRAGRNGVAPHLRPGPGRGRVAEPGGAVSKRFDFGLFVMSSQRCPVSRKSDDIWLSSHTHITANWVILPTAPSVRLGAPTRRAPWLTAGELPRAVALVFPRSRGGGGGQLCFGEGGALRWTRAHAVHPVNARNRVDR